MLGFLDVSDNSEIKEMIGSVGKYVSQRWIAPSVEKVCAATHTLAKPGNESKRCGPGCCDRFSECLFYL